MTKQDKIIPINDNRSDFGYRIINKWEQSRHGDIRIEHFAKEAAKINAKMHIADGNFTEIVFNTPADLTMFLLRYNYEK